MSKQIKQFREEEYGLFIDLVNKPASVALDTHDGSLLLNEGSGDDCFDGACLEANNLQEFAIHLKNNSAKLLLIYGPQKKHLLGEFPEEMMLQACQWVGRANHVIDSSKGGKCIVTDTADNWLTIKVNQ